MTHPKRKAAENFSAAFYVSVWLFSDIDIRADFELSTAVFV